VTSKVAALYGDAIRGLVRSTLEQLDAADLSVTLDDRGALPFTLMARLEAAVRRLRPGTSRAALPAVNPAARGAADRTRPRRTRLYLPGNSPKFFINAGLHGPDAVILDLEDSVPPGEKDAAAILVRNALRAVNFYGAEVMVRVNGLPAGLAEIRLLAPHGVQTFLLPKVETPDEVVAADRLLAELAAVGQVAGEIYLIPIIESARGALQAWPIAAASPRVVALAIGLEDYTRDIGAQRTPEGRESLWARGQVLNAARAAGIQPLASVFADVDDAQGLRAWAEAERGLGFEGVGCIHPRQVRVVHEAFRPSAAEVEQARRIVAAFDAAQAAGLGVVAVDGKMVDAPVVERARRTLRLAEMG
jgi:citrate lyase subunit beta/citryl-CoA lyase